MNFHSATFWQAGENHSALLFQHYCYQDIAACLLVLCEGKSEARGRAGAYLTGQLLRWFRRLPFGRLARNPEKAVRILGNKSKRLLGRLDKELEDGGLICPEESLPVSGILCVDDRFFLFFRGGQKIFLLNRSFGRGSIRCLSDGLRTDEGQACAVTVRQGILQQDVGILLATESFCRSLTESEIRECLYVDELWGEEQIRRRLSELGRRGESLGNKDMAAGILLSRA